MAQKSLYIPLSGSRGRRMKTHKPEDQISHKVTASYTLVSWEYHLLNQGWCLEQENGSQNPITRIYTDFFMWCFTLPAVCILWPLSSSLNWSSVSQTYLGCFPSVSETISLAPTEYFFHSFVLRHAHTQLSFSLTASPPPLLPDLSTFHGGRGEQYHQVWELLIWNNQDLNAFFLKHEQVRLPSSLWTQSTLARAPWL